MTGNLPPLPLAPESSTPPLSSEERGELRHGKGSRLPLALVLLSVALAVALPQLAEERITGLRDDINLVATPARVQVSEILLHRALEAAQLRGYFLAGDERMAERFRASRSRRREAERQLIELTQRLERGRSGAMARAAVRMRELNTGLDSLIVPDSSRLQSVDLMESQRERFLVIQALADTLSAAIDSTAQARRDAIQKTENLVARLTGLLLILGLGAAFLVARLGSRYRVMALRLDESEKSARDTSDRERTARGQAEERQLELERVTESRARLIRGFTHDVKNPLGAADGYLALIEDGVMGDVPERIKGAVGKVRRSIGQALELIAQLLEVARAEAGQLEIHRRPTDVSELVREVAEMFSAQATAKRLTLDVETNGEVPIVETDPTRVRQVVGNLVSNAVKYTGSGGHVTVRAHTAGNGGDSRHVMVAVSDDGPGIPREKLPLLFKEFTRFNASAADGSGIGLAISHRVAQALGGDLTVESEPGKGSTFVLRLPARST